MKWLLTGLFFITLASTALAQEFNAGFVQGLWYQDKVMFVDTPTRIYVAVRNNTGADLTGTVEFFDNDNKIERNNISALDGRIIESWADWTPTYGEHTITATISRIELHQVGSSTQAVEIVSASASDTFFVDYDTDNDGVGNQEDADDDNDGISDEEEKSNGTDPLDATDPETNNNENDNTQSANDDLGTDSDNNRTSNDPEGLEKYTDEGQIDSILSSVTEVINNTKRQVDDYRSERNMTDDSNSATMSNPETVETNSSSSTPTSTELSFGADSSSSNYSSINDKLSETPVVQSEDSENILDSITKMFNFMMSGFGGIYSILLVLVSFYLANPVVVQISLLSLLLLIIYKITKKLGRRRYE